MSRGQLQLGCELAAGVVAAAALHAPARAQTFEELRGMSIEQLANVQVTSVSKRAQPVSDAPSAIYVITHDDIIRSGATTIPEVLRLAPNLQVANITASSYAITARGFNGNAANKLLVLIDGRSVYTPLFGGVLWDDQDVPLDNIDRIEVISGPGATLWGANAVNGVINIITLRADQTPGGLVELQVGDHAQSGRSPRAVGHRRQPPARTPSRVRARRSDVGKRGPEKRVRGGQAEVLIHRRRGPA